MPTPGPSGVVATIVAVSLSGYTFWEPFKYVVGSQAARRDGLLDPTLAAAATPPEASRLEALQDPTPAATPLEAADEVPQVEEDPPRQVAVVPAEEPSSSSAERPSPDSAAPADALRHPAHKEEDAWWNSPLWIAPLYMVALVADTLFAGCILTCLRRTLCPKLCPKKAAAFEALREPAAQTLLEGTAIRDLKVELHEHGSEEQAQLRLPQSLPVERTPPPKDGSVAWSPNERVNDRAAKENEAYAEPLKQLQGVVNQFTPEPKRREKENSSPVCRRLEADYAASIAVPASATASPGSPGMSTSPLRPDSLRAPGSPAFAQPEDEETNAFAEESDLDPVAKDKAPGVLRQPALDTDTPLPMSDPLTKSDTFI